MGGQETARPKRTGVFSLAVRLVLQFVAALVGAGAIIVAASAWRLSQGPISLAPLTPYLQDAVQLRDAGLRIALGDTVLSWAGWDRTLDIRAMNARIENPDGTTLINVPAMSFGLSARAMLRGRIVPTTISVIGLELRIRRAPDGTFDLGLGDAASDESEQAGRSVFAALIDQLARQQQPDADPGLSKIRVVDATISFDDQLNGRKWSAEQADLVLARDLGGVRGSLDLALQLGRRTAHIATTGRFDWASMTTGINVRFADIDPASLAEQHDDLAWLEAARLPVSGSVDIGLDRDLRLLRFAYDLRAGPGMIDLPSLYPEPIAVQFAAARGSVGPDLATVKLQSLRLVDDRVTVDLQGSVERRETGFAIDLTGGVTGLQAQYLSRYWPAPFAERTRKWVVSRIRAGKFGTAKFRVNLTPETMAQRPLPHNAIDLRFSFEGAEMDYLPPLTKLTGAVGSAHLTGRTFEATVRKAAAGPLALSEGSFRIADISAHQVASEIGFVVSGRIADQVALLDASPFSFLGRVGIKPGRIGGLAATRIRLGLPLRRKVDFKSVEVAAAANLRDASIANLLGRFNLAGGTFTLRANQGGMELDGTATINGVPVTMQWIQEFESRKEFNSYYRFTGIVDDAGRAAFGLSLDPWLVGPAGVVVNLAAEPGGPAVADVTLNLTESTLSIAPIGWRKAPGLAGNLTFVARFQPDRPIQLERINLVTAGLSATGNAMIGRQGRLHKLALGRVEMGETHLAATIEVKQDDGYVISAIGPSLDLRSNLADLLAGSTVDDDAGDVDDADDGPGVPFTLETQFERVLLGDRLTMRNVAGSIRHDGSRVVTADALGEFADGKRLRLRLVPEATGRRLQIVADDAGAVVRAAGINENFVGGTFRLEGWLPDDRTGKSFEGWVRLEEFRVVRAPVLAKILGIASLTGIGDMLSGEGIYFKRAMIPFHLIGRRVQFVKARAAGPALGITAAGSVNLADDSSSIAGTIVPSYTLNSVLGVIPLLGKILVPEGEGIFGITYKVSGPIDDPVVDVNPLSALTPGILRRMFFAPVTDNGDQAGGDQSGGDQSGGGQAGGG